MSLEIYKLAVEDTLSVKFLKEQMAALKWKPGQEDLECFLTFNDPGLYIGKLNGAPIGCVSFNKYSNTYWTFGVYLVEEKHRGKGYGMQMFKTAMKQVDWSQNISVYSVPEMLEKYEQHGFEARWKCTHCEVNLITALAILEAIPLQKQGLTAKGINDVEKESLLSYDTAVFGYPRHTFISKWLHCKGSYAKVAVNRDGEIVGYGVARMGYVKEDGYIVGPLFADSTEAAQVLLKSLIEEIVSNGSVSSFIAFYCPVERNAHSKELMELLQGEWQEDIIYMTTKSIPKGSFDKWFSLTSADV